MVVAGRPDADRDACSGWLQQQHQIAAGSAASFDAEVGRVEILQLRRQHED